MPAFARRSLLFVPLLAAPSVRAATWSAIPPFREWIGRTALLRGEGGAARLLLRGDGSGLMAVRLFFFCRALPVLAWQIEGDGLAVRYRRVSALDSNRVIAGEAQILPQEAQVVWIESTRRTAAFEGFAGPELAGHCE